MPDLPSWRYIRDGFIAISPEDFGLIPQGVTAVDQESLALRGHHKLPEPTRQT